MLTSQIVLAMAKLKHNELESAIILKKRKGKYLSQLSVLTVEAIGSKEAYVQYVQHLPCLPCLVSIKMSVVGVF